MEEKPEEKRIEEKPPEQKEEPKHFGMFAEHGVYETVKD